MTNILDLNSNESILAAAAKEGKRLQGADKRFRATTQDVTLRGASLHGAFALNEHIVASTRTESDEDFKPTSQNTFAKESGLTSGAISKGRTVILFVLERERPSKETSAADAVKVGKLLAEREDLDVLVTEVTEGLALAAEELECAVSVDAIYNALKGDAKPEADPYAQWVNQTEMARNKGVTVAQMVAFLAKLDVDTEVA
jgi:hypothetical protein